MKAATAIFLIIAFFPVAWTVFGGMFKGGR